MPVVDRFFLRNRVGSLAFRIQVCFSIVITFLLFRLLEALTDRLSSNASLSVTANLSSVAIFNYVTDVTYGERSWRRVGTFNGRDVKLTDAQLPRGARTTSGSDAHRLRVATTIAPPFVMCHRSFNATCLRNDVTLTSVPVLQIKRAGRLTQSDLDSIFADFANKKSSQDYDVICCQGLSVNVLQALANDLSFDFQLYVAADHKYGALSQQTDSWNGLVGELQRGVADVAMAAFSATKQRSDVIDFSHPYFYSGFSILVAEKKRKIPIYAFLEPFDGFVWVGVVVTATVVAVVLAVFEWNSPFGLNPWGRKRKTNYTLGSGLNMVYAILFGHTVKTKSPKAWPSKWLQNFWAGASIFIYSSYTANLAAFLAGKNTALVVANLYDQAVGVRK